jgi:hypothetical protein
MLVTKEQLEALVTNYIKSGKNSDESIGFIDGINQLMELLEKINKNKYKLA